MIRFEDIIPYGPRWEENVNLREKLTAEQKALISSTEVVMRAYGLAMVFHLKSGGHKDLMLSRKTKLKIGDPADLENGYIATYQRLGDKDIYRWHQD